MITVCSTFQLSIVSGVSFKKDGIDFNNVAFINVYIDGQNLFDLPFFEDAFLYFEELRKSANSAGKFLLLTCACGIADDGGWEGVDVIHTHDSVEWDMISDDFSPTNYKFSKEHYVSEIYKIKEELLLLGVPLEPVNVFFPENW